jgi:ubiquinone/menaquinone biosynthesis C-methylase UbiE
VCQAVYSDHFLNFFLLLLFWLLLCSGVGFSTRALHAACPEAEVVIGVDTSPEMVAMARFMTDHIDNMRQTRLQILEVLRPVLPSLAMTAYWMVGDMMKRATTVASFVKGNAQRTSFPDKSFDLVTIMYAFHEAPRHGRYLMLREARRLLEHGGRLAIVDICPTYTPSATMLMGEPYVLEYQQNIRHQIETMKGFRLEEYQTIIPGQLVMWTLTRDNPKTQHKPRSP